MSSFYLKPSEIGIICNVNKWKKVSDIIDSYLMKSPIYSYTIRDFKNNFGISTAINSLTNHIKNSDNIINATDIKIQTIQNNSVLINDPKDIQNITDKINTNSTYNIEPQVVKNIIIDSLVNITKKQTPELSGVKTIIDIQNNKDKINNIYSSKLKNELNSNINTNYGNLNENNILKIYETSNNTILEIPKSICEFNNNNIRFRGICDGIDINNKKIVEAKCRVNRLFDYLPKYELYQCQCYMMMYDYDYCDLIQYHNGLHNIIEIRRDHILWNTYITPILKRYILLLEYISNNRDSIIKFYTMGEEEKVLLINNWLYV